MVFAYSLPINGNGDKLFDNRHGVELEDVFVIVEGDVMCIGGDI